MKILLIGGTGVLSTAVTTEALSRGIQVTMINRGHGKIPDGVNLIKTDRLCYSYIKSQIKDKKFDAIIDFLCYSDKDTTESFELYKNYTNQYFFISSCAVYDTRTRALCFEDSPKVLPMWTYSVNKWASEQHLMKLIQDSNVYYTIIRPCVTYGDTRIPYGISPQYGYHWTLIERIRHNKPIIRWNGGVNRCNMTRVEDFAIGVVGLIGNPKAYNEIFNVCGEETPSFNDVISILGKLVGKKVVIFDITSQDYAKEIPNRAGEILGGRSIDAINSNQKIKRVVPEFKQNILIEEGIKMTYEAYKSNNHFKGIDWTFDADTDRIIAKYCKKNGITTNGMNLGFIDYLNDSTAVDRIAYWLEYHKNNLLIKCIMKYRFFTSHVIIKIKRFIRLFLFINL